MNTSIQIYTRTTDDGYTSSIMVLKEDEKFYTHPEDKHFFDLQFAKFDEPIKIEATTELQKFFKSEAVELEPLVTVYEREQHYGGPEEGGWYWHSDKATTTPVEETNLSLDGKRSDFNSYGEGSFLVVELFIGSEEKTKKPHWW